MGLPPPKVLVLPLAFSGLVRGLSMPFPLVVVSGGWPSELMAIISLGLALVGAYFLSRFHQYFKPKGSVNS
jgi:hypothetical protein